MSNKKNKEKATRVNKEFEEENQDVLLLYIYDDGSVQKKYVIE